MSQQQAAFIAARERALNAALKVLQAEGGVLADGREPLADAGLSAAKDEFDAACYEVTQAAQDLPPYEGLKEVLS